MRKPEPVRAPVTVREFIEWLKTQDQDAIVEVIKHTDEGGYYMQGGSATTVNFSLEPEADLFEHTDFRDNPYVKPESDHYNKRYLRLGVLKG